MVGLVSEVTKRDLSSRDKGVSRGVGVPLLEAARANFGVFCSEFFGVRLYGWQWLVAQRVMGGSRRVAACTSRQIGKSMLASLLCLWALVFNKSNSGPGKNTKIGIISRSEDQSKKIVREMRNFVQIGDTFCKKYSEYPGDVWSEGYFSGMIDKTRAAESTKTAITLKPSCGGSVLGSYVKSFAPTDRVLGNTFDWIIEDESSRIEDDIHYRAIVPTGDKYDAVFLSFSTPNGLSGHFYDIMDPLGLRENNDWDRFLFTVDAIKQDDPEQHSRNMKKIGQMNASGKSLLVRQEYYGEFVTSENSYFDAKDVDAMIGDYTEFWGWKKPCDCGVDFGGLKTSRTVITISYLEKETGLIRRIFRRAYEPKTDGTLVSDLAELRTRFDIQRFIVDGCPEGSFAIKDMKSRGWDVVEMNFAGEKLSKYGEFRAALHSGRIKTFMDDQLVEEMRALAQIRGVQRTMVRAPKGYADDLVDSFVMSVYFFIADQEPTMLFAIDDGKSSIPPELVGVLASDADFELLKKDERRNDRKW